MSLENLCDTCEPSTGAFVPPNETEDPPALTHHEAVRLLRRNLREMLTIDPILKEIVRTPAELLVAEELDSLIALERGQAMSILVERAVGGPIRTVVPEDARIVDLKRAIRRAFNLEQLILGDRKVAVSWKHVWRTNWLHFNHVRLKDDSAKLKEFGIVNRSRVGFVRKRKGD